MLLYYKIHSWLNLHSTNQTWGTNCKVILCCLGGGEADWGQNEVEKRKEKNTRNKLQTNAKVSVLFPDYLFCVPLPLAWANLSGSWTYACTSMHTTASRRLTSTPGFPWTPLVTCLAHLHMDRQEIVFPGVNETLSASGGPWSAHEKYKGLRYGKRTHPTHKADLFFSKHECANSPLLTRWCKRWISLCFAFWKSRNCTYLKWLHGARANMIQNWSLFIHLPTHLSPLHALLLAFQPFLILL